MPMPKKYFTEEESVLAKRGYYKKWAQKNQEKIKERSAQYRKDNRDKINNKQKEDRKRDPEKYSKKLKEYRESNIRRFLGKKFSNTKNMCRRIKKQKREIEIDLDFLTLLYERQNGKCAISHYPMTLKFNCIYGVSIDRIDSSKGYIPGNVQLLCQVMNFAKNGFNNEDIIKFWNDRPS
tara:strand:+ start:2470 stop:3006 length:537 start_codon:yes stop_codon:yes gene_type:complete